MRLPVCSCSKVRASFPGDLAEASQCLVSFHCRCAPLPPSRPRLHNALCAPAGTLRTTFVPLCSTPRLHEHNHNSAGQYEPLCYNSVTKHHLFVSGQGASVEPGGGSQGSQRPGSTTVQRPRVDPVRGVVKQLTGVSDQARPPTPPPPQGHSQSGTLGARYGSLGVYWQGLCRWVLNQQVQTGDF